jgi:hypothetical protein
MADAIDGLKGWLKRCSAATNTREVWTAIGVVFLVLGFRANRQLNLLRHWGVALSAHRLRTIAAAWNWPVSVRSTARRLTSPDKQAGPIR